MPINAHGQPIGDPVPGWGPRPLPDGRPLDGRYCRLERLDADVHAAGLFTANAMDATGESWTYLSYGPFADPASYREWISAEAGSSDPLFYAVIDPAHGAVGVASYLRMDAPAGSIEVGHIHYSPLLQRQRAATEVMYLLMEHAFDGLGYRRYEWKCDALNAPSRSAAERLGFTYEGTFRQAKVNRGRNRDTAWYSIIDSEWPRLRSALLAWLDPANFDAESRQRARLAQLKQG